MTPEHAAAPQDGTVTIISEDPGSADAIHCVAQYYAELARRFEGGFDGADKGYAGRDGSAEQSTYFALVRRDGAPAGCASLVWDGGKTGEIKRMWIKPEARGMGIARRLLAHIEGAARENGLTALRLDTNRTLPEAQALYRSAGYHDIPRYSDNPYAHFWFGKKL